ncbi:hypothetical protein BHM03_00010141 [Ensete ventricosum]|nr:hypothetical protein BHM03_00010141 [Ensete ventricosum]
MQAVADDNATGGYEWQLWMRRVTARGEGRSVSTSMPMQLPNGERAAQASMPTHKATLISYHHFTSAMPYAPRLLATFNFKPDFPGQRNWSIKGLSPRFGVPSADGVLDEPRLNGESDQYVPPMPTPAVEQTLV